MTRMRWNIGEDYIERAMSCYELTVVPSIATDVGSYTALRVTWRGTRGLLLGLHCALDPWRGGGNSSLRGRFHIHGGFARGGGKSSLLLSTARPGPYLLTTMLAGWARRRHAIVGDKIELHSHRVDVSSSDGGELLIIFFFCTRCVAWGRCSGSWLGRSAVGCTYGRAVRPAGVTPVAG